MTSTQAGSRRMRSSNASLNNKRLFTPDIKNNADRIRVKLQAQFLHKLCQLDLHD